MITTTMSKLCPNMTEVMDEEMPLFSYGSFAKTDIPVHPSWIRYPTFIATRVGDEEWAINLSMRDQIIIESRSYSDKWQPRDSWKKQITITSLASDYRYIATRWLLTHFIETITLALI